eukprot:767196-Hanusia_phi.AAC.1
MGKRGLGCKKRIRENAVKEREEEEYWKKVVHDKRQQEERVNKRQKGGDEGRGGKGDAQQGKVKKQSDQHPREPEQRAQPDQRKHSSSKASGRENKETKGTHVSQRTSDSRCWEVGLCPVKGRIMVAARDIEQGEVILEEEPLVAASWHSHRCIECHEPHGSSECRRVREKYPASVADNMEAIEAFLQGLESIEELDSARRFIKLLSKSSSDPAVMQHLKPCTAANLESCREAIGAIKKDKQAKGIIPSNVSDEDAARLLSILNTNSHELGEWGGSGLFLLGCLMEHSCLPNCNFSTYGTHLWVTALTSIKKGENLSIDYNDSTFEPTTVRRQLLKDSYDFLCECPRCNVLPDVMRAFLCPVKNCKGKDLEEIEEILE